MKSRGFTLCMLVAASLATLPVAAFAACDVRSGQNTAALVPRTLLAMIRGR